MESKYKGLETIFNTFYPTGFVIGVFYAAEDNASAAQALHDAGFSDVRTFTPQEMLARYEELAATQNPLQRVGAAIESDERLDAEAMSSWRAGDIRPCWCRPPMMTRCSASVRCWCHWRLQPQILW